jgi:VIT1/CCC1 family predicted Fe2+/Mn2+ transporter
MERRHIEEVPDGEREEIRQIFAAKGFAGAELDAVVRVITDDVERWVETMVREEHGISGLPPAPRRAAGITFVSFVAIGLVPLLPFLLVETGVPLPEPYLWSAIGTAAAFFGVGAAKGRFVDQPPIVSGLETLLLGGAAAALSYAVGMLLRGLAG